MQKSQTIKFIERLGCDRQVDIKLSDNTRHIGRNLQEQSFNYIRKTLKIYIMKHIQWCQVFIRER